MSDALLATAVLTAVTTFAEAPTTINAKALRTTLRDAQQSSGGRFDTEAQALWKVLQPSLGAFIDGRQNAAKSHDIAVKLATMLAARTSDEPAAPITPAPVPAPEVEPDAPVAQVEPAADHESTDAPAA